MSVYFSFRRQGAILKETSNLVLLVVAKAERADGVQKNTPSTSPLDNPLGRTKEGEAPQGLALKVSSPNGYTVFR